jgi:hypothetical protein
VARAAGVKGLVDAGATAVPAIFHHPPDLHPATANKSKDAARVSVASFCNADIGRSTRLYGPVAEIVSDGSPPVYRSVTVREFLVHYDRKGLDGRPALDYFLLDHTPPATANVY